MKEKYLSFEDAKKYIHSLNIKTKKEWRKLCDSNNLPNNIPEWPEVFYKKKGWISWNDWLKENIKKVKKSTVVNLVKKTKKSADLELIKKKRIITKKYKTKIYLSFEDAHVIVKKLKLVSWSEWLKFKDSKRMPTNIPKLPNVIYKKTGWISCNHWINNGKLSTHEKHKHFFSYTKAVKYVKNLNIQSLEEWKSFCLSGDKPDFIPKSPDWVYSHKKKGWISWNHFLNISDKSIQLNELKELMQKHNIKTQKEYHEFRKKLKK
jgi:hypothetical protein